MPAIFFVLEGKKVKAVDEERWHSFIEEKEAEGSNWTSVALTDIRPYGSISTAFILGINHNAASLKPAPEPSLIVPIREDDLLPLLFETRVFMPCFKEMHGIKKRYSTWQDAERGHAEIVNIVKEHIQKAEQIES